jgi:phosphoribosylamine--glycine ligase
MNPTIQAMIKEDKPYHGVLYGGLMITNEGPKVMEFNARFGDPETQVILPRLKSDLFEIMLAVTDNNLKSIEMEWHEDACVGVVMASGGYPGSFKKELPISGLNDVDNDIMVFHAGTKIDSSGKIVTDGGRVLSVVALGKISQKPDKKFIIIFHEFILRDAITDVILPSLIDKIYKGESLCRKLLS